MDTISIAIDAAISYQATVLIQILVNIAIGDVKGIYEQTTIAMLSTDPEVIENITTIKAIINSYVIGITDVFISSNLDTVEPTAPNINAYMRNPRMKNTMR